MSSSHQSIPLAAVSQKWSRKVAIRTAESDWTDDVARFSGDAGINAWYAKVRNTHSFLACCRRHCLLALSIYRFCLASTTRTPGPCLPLLLSAPSKCAFCAVENCVSVSNASTCKFQSELVVFFMQVRKVFQRDARESVAKLGWTALFSMCAQLCTWEALKAS